MIFQVFFSLTPLPNIELELPNNSPGESSCFWNGLQWHLTYQFESCQVPTRFRELSLDQWRKSGIASPVFMMWQHFGRTVQLVGNHCAPHHLASGGDEIHRLLCKLKKQTEGLSKIAWVTAMFQLGPLDSEWVPFFGDGEQGDNCIIPTNSLDPNLSRRISVSSRVNACNPLKLHGTFQHCASLKACGTVFNLSSLRHFQPWPQSHEDGPYGAVTQRKIEIGPVGEREGGSWGGCL